MSIESGVPDVENQASEIDKDLEEREQQKKYYILSKIKSLNEKAADERQKMITNLPKFESDYELLHEKFYNV